LENLPLKERKAFETLHGDYFGMKFQEQKVSWYKRALRYFYPWWDYNPHKSHFEPFYDYKKDQYIYQYKDHLGNTRVSFGRNSAGALEIVGYQSQGKKSTGDKLAAGGVDTSEGANVTKKVAFRGNSKKNAGLLSAIVTEIPNPSSKEGYNFRNIAEALNYYKGEYLKARGNKPTGGVDYSGK
jgi:hypothetical protein